MGMKTSGSKVMTAPAAYRAVAESTGVKPRDVKGALEAYVGVAADQIKKNGPFKLCGALNLKLKKTPGKPARKGVNPFTKEPCVFKAKPASKTVKALPMKKLKELVNLACTACDQVGALEVTVGGLTRPGLSVVLLFSLRVPRV